MTPINNNQMSEQEELEEKLIKIEKMSNEELLMTMANCYNLYSRQEEKMLMPQANETRKDFYLYYNEARRRMSFSLDKQLDSTLISHERAEAYNEGYLKGAKQERVGIEETYKDIRAEAVKEYLAILLDLTYMPKEAGTKLRVKDVEYEVLVSYAEEYLSNEK